MLVGYARVSTAEQSPALQEDALIKAGCGRTFSDVEPAARPSGAVEERAGLAAALDYVRSGDTLVVWRLDRLGRTLRRAQPAPDRAGERARHPGRRLPLAHARAQPEAIDTTTSGGKLVFHIFGALAEFERELIRERARAGLAAARARGRMGGRPRALSDTQLEMARMLLADTSRPIDEVCGALHVSRATLYRHVPAHARPARAVLPERVAHPRPGAQR